MMRQHGILIVNRMEMMRRMPRGAGGEPAMRPSLELSVGSVFRCYRGFDGVLWPDGDELPFSIEDGLVAIEEWGAVGRYLKRLACRDECDVVLLSRGGLDDGRVRDLGWSRAGVDVGYCEAEYSRFSVILNEILFGRHDALRRFAARLNRCLLFDTLQDARELLAERARLVAANLDLEAEPPVMAPIVVYIRETGMPSDVQDA